MDLGGGNEGQLFPAALMVGYQSLILELEDINSLAITFFQTHTLSHKHMHKA